MNPAPPDSSPLHQDQTKAPGNLYLIPTPLGPDSENRVLPPQVIQTLHRLDLFFVEKIRKAVSFLRWIKHPLPDYRIRFYPLNRSTPPEELHAMISEVQKGDDAGVLSEAGCPAIADPGSSLVGMAHAHGVRVVPLVGPSSILLALMASGFNGQNFSFWGYLPKPGPERKNKIRKLEEFSRSLGAAQIFIETPYRNNDLMAELLRELSADTRLCVASSLTLSQENIVSRRISDWKKQTIELNGQPAIFLIQAYKSDRTRKSMELKSAGSGTGKHLNRRKGTNRRKRKA